MKMILACILILSSLQGFSQKKGKVDPKDVAIDSLTKVTTMLTTQLDSTSKAAASLSMNLDSASKDLIVYKGLYTTIKEKVVMKDFDPATMGQIIDSLRTGRETAFSGLKATSTALSDSLTVLTQENTTLKAKVASLEAAAADKEKLIAELKQLKELLDANIISQEEFDTKKAKLMAKWE